MNDRDLEELRAALRDRFSDLARELIDSELNSRLSNRRELKFGSHGKISVVIAGPKAGLWQDRSSGQGGDAFSMIRVYTGCATFAAQVAWAQRWLGLSDDDAISDAQRQEWNAAAPQRAAEKEARRLREEAEEAARVARRIAKARENWDRCKPIGGTLGERYLLETRKIPQPSGPWPAVLGFDPVDQALAVRVVDGEGLTIAVQQIFLDGKARKRRDRGGAGVKKRSWGPVGSGLAVLPAVQPGGPIAFAEGPESGLSVWSITGLEVNRP